MESNGFIRWVKKLGSTLKRLFIFLGIIFSLLIFLSFTDYPYNIYHWLGTSECKPIKSPDYIILMGAGGFPGPESLLRCYYTALTADSFPESRVVVAYPVAEGAFEGSENQLMVSELLKRGISSERIYCETEGTNTIGQAKLMHAIIEDNQASILIVSSPEHIYRCVRTFRKQGFTNVNGLPTFEQSTNDDDFYTSDEKKTILKHPERNVTFRYNMWSYLHYEIIVLRELTAIAYYKMMGHL